MVLWVLLEAAEVVPWLISGAIASSLSSKTDPKQAWTQKLKVERCDLWLVVLSESAPGGPLLLDLGELRPNLGI
ncbi:hypothetical protein GUJ93_ZPchr0009g1026 [Zizania palustris]|uniref:Secreted protein n=1 Tax=Zizania palustris TaxID=103762 RepID=A0A8J5R1S8_ZIZPA|nr:hypothetical protein GUJ93_ZPchr0009g1026 [Zizania palustris]